MITVTTMYAVWSDLREYEHEAEPIAVCPTLCAARAVFNLLNPKPNERGCSNGPYPMLAEYYLRGERPDLDEDFPAAPSARFLDLTEAYRETQEAGRDDEAARQRKLGYYA